MDEDFIQTDIFAFDPTLGGIFFGTMVGLKSMIIELQHSPWYGMI